MPLEKKCVLKKPKNFKSKIKVLKNHLFYLALTHLKKGDRDTAQEKLKEAQAVTGLDIASFVKSEPYVSKETVETLKNELQDIAG